jgi:hypothetical protein
MEPLAPTQRADCGPSLRLRKRIMPSEAADIQSIIKDHSFLNRRKSVSIPKTTLVESAALSKSGRKAS